MISNTLKIICLLLFILKNVDCYPTVRSNVDTADTKLDTDEKRYPNRTDVGKYSYTDNEGNPIQVKYYADDASYGVELKSIKVMSGTSDDPLTQAFKQSGLETLLQNSESPVGTSTEFYNPTNKKYKTSDTFEILNKDKNSPYKKNFKTSPDYDIYFQNELNAPKKCGKDKVRVYLDKEKRKIREASQNYIEAAKYCNQF